MGCVTTQQATICQPLKIKIYCPREPKLQLKELDNTKPIDDIDNLELLSDNLSIVVTHALKLEETINCYESVVKHLESQNVIDTK